MKDFLYGVLTTVIVFCCIGGFCSMSLFIAFIYTEIQGTFLEREHFLFSSVMLFIILLIGGFVGYLYG